MYNNLIISKLQKAFPMIDIIKTEKASWKNVNGLRKLVLYKDLTQQPKDFDYYAFVDMGNSVTKAVLTDKDGNLVAKALELLTIVATPNERPSNEYKAIPPLDDLEFNISGNASKGNGSFAVSKLALVSGLNKKYRDSAAIQKSDDDIFYIMINVAIATLLSQRK